MTDSKTFLFQFIIGLVGQYVNMIKTIQKITNKNTSIHFKINDGWTSAWVNGSNAVFNGYIPSVSFKWFISRCDNEIEVVTRPYSIS
jgi:hypothetical protein